MENEALDYIVNYIVLIKKGESSIARVSNKDRFKKEDFDSALNNLKSVGYKITPIILQPQNFGQVEKEGYEITWVNDNS